MVTRILILVALVAALTGCEKRSTLYCEKNPDDLAHCDPPPDAPPPMMCADNSSCTTEDRPFCQLDSHVCVECLSNDDCHDPVKLNCDPLSFTCRGCSKHTDCPSNACLPGGLCGNDSQVIYLDPQNGVDTNSGTMGKPVKTWTKALSFVTDTRLYLKVTGTTNTSVVIDTKKVIVLADPGTKVIGSADPAFEIKKSQVKIVDLEIECPSAPMMDGLKSEMMSSTTLEHVYIHSCTKLGINSTEKFLAVSRSNIESNAGGGIATGANVDYVLTNNFIVHNGSASSMRGGVDLGSITLTNRFEFNTVAHNQIAGLLDGAGVTCAASLVNPLPLPNSLFVANTGGSGNISGGCTASGSTDTANDAPLAFVNTTMAPYNYHIHDTSTAINAALTATVVGDDIDGELRPQGPNRDLGADELKQ